MTSKAKQDDDMRDRYDFPVAYAQSTRSATPRNERGRARARCGWALSRFDRCERGAPYFCTHVGQDGQIQGCAEETRRL